MEAKMAGVLIGMDEEYQKDTGIEVAMGKTPKLLRMLFFKGEDYGQPSFHIMLLWASTLLMFLLRSLAPKPITGATEYFDVSPVAFIIAGEEAAKVGLANAEEVASNV